MSESSITVVRVDWVSAKQIAHIGAAVTGWLLGTGVIAVNNRFDELWQPGAWMPGPRLPDTSGRSVVGRSRDRNGQQRRRHQHRARWLPPGGKR